MRVAFGCGSRDAGYRGKCCEISGNSIFRGIGAPLLGPELLYLHPARRNVTEVRRLRGYFVVSRSRIDPGPQNPRRNQQDGEMLHGLEL